MHCSLSSFGTDKDVSIAVRFRTRRVCVQSAYQHHIVCCSRLPITLPFRNGSSAHPSWQFSCMPNDCLEPSWNTSATWFESTSAEFISAVVSRKDAKTQSRQCASPTQIDPGPGNDRGHRCRRRPRFKKSGRHRRRLRCTTLFCALASMYRKVGLEARHPTRGRHDLVQSGNWHEDP
jgi:hypothetical protein